MKTIIQERREQLNQLLSISAQYLDIKEELILTNKSEEYTDVRYLIIGILSDIYSDSELSKITGLTKMGINNIRNKFRERFTRKSLQYTYNQLKNKLQQFLQP